MHKKITLAISLLVIIIVLLSTLLSSYNEQFPFSESLTVGSLVNRSNEIGFADYVANLTYGSNVKGSVYVRVSRNLNSTAKNEYHILVQLAYHNYIEYDSLSFKLDSGTTYSNIYVLPLGSPVKANFYKNGNTAIYQISDLGFLGEGTINLEFQIETYTPLNNFYLTTDVSLHETALITLTSLTAHAFFLIH